MRKIAPCLHTNSFGMLLGCFILWLSAPGTVRALDPGYASGVLALRGETIALTHAYAWRHGGPGLDKTTWSVLLTDREVPIDLLSQPGEQCPRQWAQEGRLKGVLLRQHSKASGHQWTTLPLRYPDAQAKQLTGFTYRLGPQGLRIFGDVELNEGNVSEPDGSFTVKAHFSAPVFHGKPLGCVNSIQ